MNQLALCIRIIIGLDYASLHFFKGDIEVRTNAFEDFAKIASCVQAVDLGIEVNGIPFFPAAMTVKFPTLIIDIERWFVVIMERAGRLVFIPADFLKIREILFIEG